MITVAVANHGGAESQNSDVNGGRSVNGKRLAMVAVTALVILVTVGLLLSPLGGAPNKAAMFSESPGNLPAGLSSLHSESSRTVLLKPAVSTTYVTHFAKTRWPIVAAVSVALFALAVLAIVLPLLSSEPEVSDTIENQPTDDLQVDNDLVDEEEPEFFGIQVNLGYLVAGAVAFIILVVVVWAIVGRVGGNQDEDQPQQERLNTPNKQNQISKQQQQQQEPEEQEEEEQENSELEQDGQQRQEIEQQKQAVPDDQRKNKEEQQEAMPRQQEEQRNQEEGEETEQQEEQSQEELNEEQQKLRAARSLRKDEKRLQKQERLGLRKIRLEEREKLEEEQKKKQEKEKWQQLNRQRKQQQPEEAGTITNDTKIEEIFPIWNTNWRDEEKLPRRLIILSLLARKLAKFGCAKTYPSIRSMAVRNSPSFPCHEGTLVVADSLGPSDGNHSTAFIALSQITNSNKHAEHFDGIDKLAESMIKLLASIKAKRRPTLSSFNAVNNRLSEIGMAAEGDADGGTPADRAQGFLQKLLNFDV